MPDTLTEINETDTGSRSIAQFVPFEKVDKEQRLVYGTISSESLDSQNQIVEKQAIENALTDYMKFGNIREMHQPSAVGKAQQIWFEDGKWKIIAKIVDDMAWKKVKEKVYNGFSIGGRTKPGGIKKVQQDGKFVERLTAIVMSEISLADAPSCPDATIDMWKVAGLENENQNSNNNEGGAAVMPPEELVNQTQGDVAATTTAADTTTPAQTPEQSVTEPDQVVETQAGNIAKSKLDAAFAAANATIEKVVTPPPPPAPDPAPAPASAETPAGEEDISKAAGSRAVNSDETEITAIQAVLTELQGMRNTAESAGLPRKANLLGSACSAIVYLLAAINEPDRDYDFCMSALVGDLVKSQTAVEAAFTKAVKVEAKPDEGLEKIEKAVVDGLAGITDKIAGLADRVETIERQPSAGGPVLRQGAVEKTLSTGSGTPANREDRAASIAVLQKMHQETNDPIQKTRIGEAIAYEQIKLAQNFQN